MATNTRKLADLLANIDNNSKITTGGLLDATITAADLADDSVGAAEIIDDAVGAAAIADDAVTSAAIATGAVIADGIGTGAVVAAGLGAGSVTAPAIGTGAVTSTKLGDVIGGRAHIVPDKLYPAVSGKLSDGIANHSGNYGTVQADGLSYYWTEIKGSKPIKDPRIGAHFGGQRYPFKSIQLLEEESAQHGYSVWSIDGREGFRTWTGTAGCKIVSHSDGRGQGLRLDTASATFAIEVTGYFTTANIICYQNTVTHMNSCDVQIDGVSVSNNQNYGTVSTNLTNWENRYVDSTAVVKLNLGGTPLALGIHTLRFWSDSTGGNGGDFNGIELCAYGKFTDATCDTNHTSGLGSPASTSKITMDSTAKVVAGMSVTGTGLAAGTTVVSIDSATVLTLSAATTATNANQTFTFGANDISIPAQTVVSYGKKFAISATAQHYNPFATNQLGAAIAIGNAAAHGSVATGWSGTGAGYFDDTLDVATSLGLGATGGWVQSGKYYRPVNGGRIVKWIDSSGNIKTSVNMMPPAGTKPWDATATNAPESHNWGTLTTPVFSSTTIDHSQAEVAKTFHWREIGNGGANAGSVGSWDDSSTLDGSGRAISYLFEDSMTGICADNVKADGVTKPDLMPYANNDFWFFSFIGTGISRRATQHVNSIHTLAQNLPYGLHILKGYRGGSGSNSNFKIDSVDVTGGNLADGAYAEVNELTIHQPTMPPIPENAVVIADYMLMADFVVRTTGTIDTISKGVRGVSCVREHLNDTNVAHTIRHMREDTNGFGFVFSNNSTLASGQWHRTTLPYFGTDITFKHYANRTGVVTTGGGGSQVKVGGGYSAFTKHTGNTLGEHSFGKYKIYGDAYEDSIWSTGLNEIATPTHTSSHYEPFETPYVFELVGGDRNMEQNNLVVTGDGKTWNQVTRDTSYLGAQVHRWYWAGSHWSGGGTGNVHYSNGNCPWTCRGLYNHRVYGNKNFAYASKGHICLRDGMYQIHASSYCANSWANGYWSIYINGNVVDGYAHDPGGNANVTTYHSHYLTRGDYVQVSGGHSINSTNWGNFYIMRIGDNDEMEGTK